MNIQLGENQLRALCAVLADTNNGLTKAEISHHLRACGIRLVDDGHRVIGNGLAYQTGLNKRDWLLECFVQDINSRHSTNIVLQFIESALNPILYTADGKREKYSWMLEETNRVLVLLGCEVGPDGRIRSVPRAESLDEVDRRINSLKRKLYDRSIHSEVTKYCSRELLKKDYFDAVFEAAKGLAERVRSITGLSTDGGELFQAAFSTKDPFLFFNQMKTKSEISEFTGLKELLEAIFHLVRNPAAHTPKINWRVDETKALDVLTLISFAHKYLDECHRIPGK